jgi:hypothetical protein
MLMTAIAYVCRVALAASFGGELLVVSGTGLRLKALGLGSPGNSSSNSVIIVGRHGLISSRLPGDMLGGRRVSRRGISATWSQQRTRVWKSRRRSQRRLRFAEAHPQK